MKLQNIILPKSDICTDENLYFRREKGSVFFKCDNDYIEFSKNDTVCFDTYFNSISAGKWFKYTKIRKIGLSLKIIGKFILTLMYKEKISDKINTNIIARHSIGKTDAKTEYKFEFDTEKYDNMFCFSLECTDDSGRFIGGSYYGIADKKDISDVKLAVDICTYRREDYIEKNIGKFKNCFLDNPVSPLYNRLEIFISDNAGTLNIKSTNKIHIVHNKNTGGSGGFTRGMIEILKLRESHKITHILIMDDDVVINPESLYRTFVILSLIKDEYKTAFIGGGMLRADMPNIQVESGAVWNTGNIISLKHNLNLSKCESCIMNETEENPDYTGWWYCVIPAETVNKNNLPLPFFIKCDDIEYSLRNAGNIILMNGICVWHEDFETKYSSAYYYYISRNRLICNAVRNIPYSRRRFMKDLSYLATHELMMYRYKNALLLIDSGYDFLNGIEWLKSQDAQKLNADIISKGYKLEDISSLPISFSEEKYNQSCNLSDGGYKKLIRKILMNGIFLPSKHGSNGIAIVPTFTGETKHFYRIKKALNYDRFTGKGFVTEKSYREILGIYLKILKLGLISRLRYKKAVQSYCENSSELMTLEFWKKFLDID